jgi:hypothetical protein
MLQLQMKHLIIIYCLFRIYSIFKNKLRFFYYGDSTVGVLCLFGPDCTLKAMLNILQSNKHVRSMTNCTHILSFFRF